MAATKKTRNGRSPLVNPQRQITSFFCKNQQSSSSPTPIPCKRIPNRSPSTSPVAPSPLSRSSKRDKPVLVDASNATSPEKSVVVQKRKLRMLRRISLVEDVDEDDGVEKIHVNDRLEDEIEDRELNVGSENVQVIEANEKVNESKKLRRLSRASLVEDEIVG